MLFEQNSVRAKLQKFTVELTDIGVLIQGVEEY